MQGIKRQEGYDVYFQTGTDEHGQKVELKAKEVGVTPQEFVDEVSKEVKRIWDLMNTSYDHFIRTTDTSHKKQVQKMFKNCMIKEIFIKVNIKVCTARLARHFLHHHSSLMGSVRIVAESASQRRKKHTF